MMQLGVVDFVAFSGVCKSWRSFALSYMNTFMASRPSMFMFPDDGDDVDWCCHLKDVEGRRFKTVLSHSAGNICLGITCGYMILFGYRAPDFLLVNVITRHELHFPDAPNDVSRHAIGRQIQAILVFSPSISGRWVLLVLNMNTHQIWFCIVGGKGESGVWDHVSSTFPMKYIQFFKGKIYTLHVSSDSRSKTRIIGVMRLDPNESKITLLETRDFPSLTHLGLICSGENLYLLRPKPGIMFKIHKLDFDEMKWVVVDENRHAFFLSYGSHCVAIKPECWWQTQFRISTSDDLCGNETFFISDSIWYFPHECRDINRMVE